MQTTTQRTKSGRWTKSSHYDWSQQWGDLLQTLFPENHLAVAATCRIELRGKKAGRSENKQAYATAFYATMQSFGEIPAGFTGVQNRGNWIQTTNRDSLDAIMQAFGLSFDELIDVIGMPEKDESRTMALEDAVVGCDPSFAATAVAAVAVA